MINKVNTFILFAASWLMTVNAMGTSSSTDLTPPQHTPRIQCPVVDINGTQLTSINSAPKTTNFGPPECLGGYSFGTAAFVAWTGGVNFNGMCPPDHPYIGGFNEDWTLVVTFAIGGFGSSLIVTCCNYATPTMSLTKKSTTWQDGTFCP